MTEPRNTRRRVLSKAEIAEGIGAELFAICQDVTADGILTEAETKSLLEWLAANEGSAADVPAVTFLVETAKRILADGRITESERRELHRAVEAVMPKQAREAATVARREAASAQQPELRLDFMTKGASYYRDAALVNPGDELELLRDPANPHDRNAIAVVRLGGDKVGHVPREDAALAAPMLDAGANYRATCKKVLGYNHAIPVVVATIFRPGVAIEGARKTREIGTAVLSDGRVYKPSAARAVLVIAVAVFVGVAACNAVMR
jgi:hypothetical protein